MATVNLKEVMEAVQKKIYAADSSTSNLQDLIYLLKAAKRGDGTMVQQVASASVLPDLTDSAADTEMIAFVQNEGKLYFKQDSSGTTVWKTYTVTPSAPSFVYGGETSGFFSGSLLYPGGGGTSSSSIIKIPFTSDTGSSSQGSTTVAMNNAHGWSNSTNGYIAGGSSSPVTAFDLTQIEKFPMSSAASSSDTGADLSTFRGGGAANHNESYGYATAGNPVASPTVANATDKYTFANETSNAAIISGLTNVSPQMRYSSGVPSPTYAYIAGGQNPAVSAYLNNIEKFPFAAEDTVSDVGDLFLAHHSGAAVASTENGYIMGGNISPTYTNTIQKWSFSSDGNGTDVADLTAASYGSGGCSSTTAGYKAGGIITSPTFTTLTNTEKFTFSSESNSSNIGTSPIGSDAATQQV